MLGGLRPGRPQKQPVLVASPEPLHSLSSLPTPTMPVEALSLPWSRALLLGSHTFLFTDPDLGSVQNTVLREGDQAKQNSNVGNFFKWPQNRLPDGLRWY